VCVEDQRCEGEDGLADDAGAAKDEQVRAVALDGFLGLLLVVLGDVHHLDVRARAQLNAARGERVPLAALLELGTLLLRDGVWALLDDNARRKARVHEPLQHLAAVGVLFEQQKSVTRLSRRHADTHSVTPE
jgi:hypothetical protein